MSPVSIAPAAPARLPAIRALLERVGLPVSDLGRRQRFLAATDGDVLVGCVAIEPYGRAALLRSLAVAPERRGAGVGRALFDAVVDECRRSGIEEAYLLTTTVEPLAIRLGFSRVDRAAVPADVRASAEFAGACPATAACLGRKL